METEAGVRFMVIEQKGKDVWRGRYRSISEAVENNVAGLGVDRILLTRSQQHGVSTVMIVVEEQRRIFLAPIEDFFNDELAITRSNYQGRAHRILNYSRFVQKYLGPTLHTKSKRASAC